MLVTIASKKTLQKVCKFNMFFYIYCPLLFYKNIGKIEIIILIDFKNKINAINFAYVAKLDL